MDLSIIIVNWNSRDYVRNCLRTVYKQTESIRFEVIVVDNASYDGCKEMLANEYPEVRYVQSLGNMGFAKANNLGFRHSCGKYLLFLNPDTEIIFGAIQEMQAKLSSLKGTGAVGPLLLNSDSTIQTSCIRSFPTILNQILDAEIFRKGLAKSSLWGNAALFLDSAEPVEVDAVSGACLMVRRSVFEKIGRFSEDYFMYSEDIDLCYKIRRLGCKIYYIPASKVVHHGGKSTSQSNADTFSNIVMLESRKKYFEKRKSVTYSNLYIISIFMASLIRILVILIFWPIIFKKDKIVKSILRKWFLKLSWSLSLNNNSTKT